jgi:GNAT superfamily N-acetyltransferase
VAEIRIVGVKTDADLEKGLAVYNAVHPDDPSTVMEARETERQSRAFASFLAEAGEELAGGAHVRLPTYSDTAEGSVYVLETHRRLGVGDRLLERLLARASEHGAPALSVWVADEDPESLAWTERRGFRERSRQAFVELDLVTFEPRPVSAPTGVEIVSWAERPELARGLYEVACEALPDIPDSEDERVEPFEEWLSTHMQGPQDDPRGTFVAVADGDAVGFAKLSFWDAKPDAPFHDLTGVKRAWRGRGIARALKHAQLNWAKEHGYRALRTAMVERNEPIRRLNAELGYTPMAGRIYLGRAIAGSSPPPPPAA